MFESSLIDLEARQHSRRKWVPLPIAIALHGAVLASVGVAQVWNVAPVGEPDTVVPYHFVSLPEIPAAPTGSRPQTTTTAPKPPKPETTVQPDQKTIPDKPVLDPTPETSTGPIAEGPQTGEVDPNSVFTGPASGPTRGSVPSSGPIEIVPAAAPVQDEILTVGGAVSRPVLLSGQPPRYTKVALGARVQGTVVLAAVIDERGRVSNVRVLRGLKMGLDQAAVDTVQGWTFEPAKLAGRPVKVFYTLTVKFQLAA
jgi:protein TonB